MRGPCRRPLLQHARSLPDCQPRPGSPLDEAFEDTLGLSETVPSEQHFLDLLAVPGPLLNVVEVAAVGVDRIIGFFVGQSLITP